MKISELLAQLKNIQELHGDVPVRIRDSELPPLKYWSAWGVGVCRPASKKKFIEIKYGPYRT